MTDLDYHTAARLLKPDFETGKLFWKPRPPSMFRTENVCDAWNFRYACEEAFLTVNPSGYRMGEVLGKTYAAHRVLWLLHTKAWPAQFIDHINGDPSDNRIVNLRAATKRENQRNKRMQKNNTSGTVGVIWIKHLSKWRAMIGIDGRGYALGTFDNIEDAIAARKAAEKRCGFHENHGR